MPRRRKRSTQQRKPSLIFTESPVNIQTHVPTPVLCARHPPTAQTVSVLELDDLPWVSPQFNGGHYSDRRRGRQRLTRQRRKSLGAAVGAAVGAASSTNKENTMGNRRCKFKSLKFLGDEPTIESLSEDVNISCDTETTEDERNDVNPKISDFETSCDDRDVHMRDSLNPIALRQAKTSFGLSERNRVEIGDGCNTRNHNVCSCGADMHAHTHNSSGNGNTPGGKEIATDSDSIILDCADIQHGGSSSINCAHGCREQESKSDSSMSSNGWDGLPGVHVGATHKTKRKKGRKTSNLKTVLQSRFNVSSISTDSESSISAMEMHDTPNAGRKAKRRIASPVKRLFASQLVHESHIPLSSKRKSKGKSMSSLPKEGLELGNCSIETIPNSEISDACEIATPLRRSSRIAANLRQLVTVGTTPLSKIEKALKVLVPDTPDSEKDWTMRKRQVKGLHINSAV